MRSVAFSADGSRAVSGGDDKIVKVWNVAGGDAGAWALLRDLGEHGDICNSAAFSPDGSRVISGGGDFKVKLWSVDGQDPGSWGLLHDLGDHEAAVRSVAFSADGQRAISGCERVPGSSPLTKIWSVAGEDPGTWGLLRDLELHDDGGLTSVAFSADGRRAVGACDDGTVRLWSVAGQDPGSWGLLRDLGSIAAHASAASSAVFSADGRRVITGSWDGTVKVWGVAGEDPGDWGLLRDFGIGRVFGVALSPDGRYAISCADDCIKVCSVAGDDAEEWALLCDLKGPDGGVAHGGYIVRSVAFSADGRRAISGGEDNAVKIWNVPQLTEEAAPMPAQVGSEEASA